MWRHALQLVSFMRYPRFVAAFARELPALPSSILGIITALQPFRFGQLLLDFTSIVGSQFWDGRRSGPDFISPMSSLPKRQSGHLARLIIEYSKSFPKLEWDIPEALRQDVSPQAAAEVPGRDDPLIGGSSDVPSFAVEEVPDHDNPLAGGSSDAISLADAEAAGRSNPWVGARSDAVLEFTMHPEEHPHAVAVLDLDDVASDEIGLDEDPTQVDLDLIGFAPALLGLFIYLWTSTANPGAIIFIAGLLMGTLATGPGTLTLVRGTTIELELEAGCAVLMDDNLSLVIQGGERVIEAITEGGFYLSRFEELHPRAEDQIVASTYRFQRSAHHGPFYQVIYGVSEGGYHGICMAIVMLIAFSIFSVPYLGRVYVASGFFCYAVLATCWRGYRASAENNFSQPGGGVTPWRLSANLAGEAATLFPLGIEGGSQPLSTFIPLLPQVFYLYCLARLIRRSYYPIRTDQFLNTLNRPSLRKWPFITRASAATFVCLVLCRDIPRPVKNIDIMGVLDTLIPNQRDIWRVWKKRVADRVLHCEGHINFAPTVPSFPDERQERLKRLLDEAQIGYNKFLSLPPRRQNRSA